MRPQHESTPRAYDQPHVRGYNETAAQAWDEFTRTGSKAAAVRYAKERLHSVMNEEWLNQ
jgi:hypothetical protein